MSMYDGIAV